MRPFEEGLPLEAFAERVADRLRARSPAARVVFVDGDALGLRLEYDDGRATQANLDNLWRTYRMAPAERLAAEVDRYVSILVDPPPAAPRTDDIHALVRSAGLLASIREQAGREAEDGPSTPVWFPLVADLIVVLAFDLPDRVQVVTRSDLARLEATADALLEPAVLRVLGALTVERHGDGPVYLLTAGGTYEASLLLHVGLWGTLAASVEGELLASVPCRDLIYYTGSGEPRGREALEQLTRHMFRRGSYPVSPTLLRFTGAGWAPA